MAHPERPAARRRWPLILMGVAVVALLLMPTVARTWMGIGVTTVLTGSMSPAIDPGDLVVTKASTVATVGVGDVVVVDTAGSTVAHRIVEARPLNGLSRLTTKGDANAQIDTDPVLVSPTHDLPRVIWRIPALGAPLAFLASGDAQRLAVTLLVGANLIALLLFALGRRAAGTEASSEGRPEARRPAPADISSADA